MILYNVTVKIDQQIEADWREWMLGRHIPDIMQTGCFVSYKLCRIMGDDDQYGVSYAVQYFAPDLAAFELYRDEYAHQFQTEHAHRYKDQYVAFRTLMEVVQAG